MRAPAKNITWPCERFYWAILEGTGWHRAGELPAGLRPLFEDEVPHPGDELHAICIPIDGDRLLVCSARRDELASLDSCVLSLAPESLPSFAEAELELSDLNLLVGQYEPHPLRRARQRWHLASAAAMVLCALLIAFGLDRRADYHREVSRQASDAHAQFLAEVGPGATVERLRAEVAALERSTEIGRRVQLPTDASLALAELLQGWPTEIEAEPQSLAVSGQSIAMSILLEDEPGRFLEVLKVPPGWTLDQPRLNSIGTRTRLDLRFRLDEGGQS